MVGERRYAPARPFPRYAFLPGRDPHPVRDPEGHSYGETELAADYLPPSAWERNDDYLFGVDLYNHGYLWEAHEAWEGLWHVTKKTGSRPDELQGLFLQGLIQCTAAALKVRMEQPRGLERLGELGLEKLETVGRRSGGTFMGLDVFEFVGAMRRFVGDAPASADARPPLKLETSA
ncbi:MAG: DUF309 domain-containing protein [Planctomycetota bacterium]